jgi:hypothetical protein
MSRYIISTDSGSVTVTANSADEACLEHARGEGWPAIKTALDWEAYLRAQGGYGTVEDESGTVVARVAQ